MTLAEMVDFFYSWPVNLKSYCKVKLFMSGVKWNAKAAGIVIKLDIWESIRLQLNPNLTMLNCCDKQYVFYLTRLK